MHTLIRNCIHLPAAVRKSKMSLEMLKYFYKYFNRTVRPIKLESHHLCRAYWVHFCEHIEKELHDKSSSFLVQLGLLHRFYALCLCSVSALLCVSLKVL